jgi:hypothetical protein
VSGIVKLGLKRVMISAASRGGWLHALVFKSTSGVGVINHDFNVLVYSSRVFDRVLAAISQVLCSGMIVQGYI